MRRGIKGRLSVLLFLVAAGTTRLLASEDLAELIERAEKSVVRINVRGDDQESFGSGFVVSTSAIATNFHVIEGAKDATVEFVDGFKARVDGFLAADPQRDVAILSVKNLNREVLKLAEGTPRKGEHVLAIGAPKGLSFTSSDGIVSAVRSNAEFEQLTGLKIGRADRTWIQTTTPISPGNSGGPLLNAQGQVIGMNTLLRSDGQNLNFAVSATDIRRVLDDKHRSRSLKSLPEGVRIEQGGPGGPRGPDAPRQPVVNLPSGRVLDVAAIFSVDEDTLLDAFKSSRGGQLLVVKSEYPNGLLSSTVIAVDGVLNGPAISKFETGMPATFAVYTEGVLQGNLLHWNERGQAVLYAQFFKGREHGLQCLFKDDHLHLVQEINRGKVNANYLMKANKVAKTYSSPEESDESLMAALAELETAKKKLRAEEASLKKVVRDLQMQQRKKARPR